VLDPEAAEIDVALASAYRFFGLPHEVHASTTLKDRRRERVPMRMEPIAFPHELEILWRLAGRRTPGEHAVRLGQKFSDLRPRIAAVMLEMVLIELEGNPPAVRPSLSDLALLLASSNPRIRLLGIRMALFREQEP
jgi:hypothetical protein